MLTNDSVSFLHPGDIAEPHLSHLALGKGELMEGGEVVHLPCTALHPLFPLLMYSITQYGLIPKSTPTLIGVPLLFERQTYGWTLFLELTLCDLREVILQLRKLNSEKESGPNRTWMMGLL